MALASRAGITISPAPSFRNPPLGSGIGAPERVPMARIDNVAPLSASARCAVSVSNAGRPSVISNICPPCAPAVFSNSAAMAMPLVALAPGNGMIAGDSAGMRLAMVRVSSVSGVTTCASPANTTSPVTPSSRRSSRSRIFCLPLCILLGCTSAANIEALRSKTMTRASARLMTGSSTRWRLGPAAARMTKLSSSMGTQISDRCFCCG